MKFRDGFISNSSSGSFIFPEGMSEDKVERIIKKTEIFLTHIGKKPVSAGLSDPCEYNGRVHVNTLGDNTCPYAVHVILENIVGAEYVHHG